MYCVMKASYITICVSDDALSVELSNFKEQFKAHLAELIRRVRTNPCKISNMVDPIYRLNIIKCNSADFVFLRCPSELRSIQMRQSGYESPGATGPRGRIT
jgi:hypothetical protein